MPEAQRVADSARVADSTYEQWHTNAGKSALANLFTQQHDGNTLYETVFNNQWRFGEQHPKSQSDASSVLGAGDNAVLAVSPTLYAVVKKEMINGFYARYKVDEDGNGPDGKPAHLSAETEKEMRLVSGYIEAVFANQTTYAAFLANPTSAYLQTFTNTIIGAPSPTSTTNGADSVKTSQSVNVTGTPIIDTAATSAATAFFSLYGNIAFSLDSIYTDIVTSNKLSSQDIQAFQQMFATLWAADYSRTAAQAFLLAMHSALCPAVTKTGKPSVDVNSLSANFPGLMKHQLDLMGSLWGSSIRGMFQGLANTNGGELKLTSFERYASVVYANLSLGTALAGATDKTYQIGFMRAFGIGFLGGIDYTLSNVVSNNLTQLSNGLAKTVNVNPTWTAPLSAVIQATAGALNNAIQDVILNPYALLLQNLFQSYGTQIAKSIDQMNLPRDVPYRFANPLALTGPLGVLAAFSTNPTGRFGKPVVASQVTTLQQTANQTFAPNIVRDAIVKNSITVFNSAVQIWNPDNSDYYEVPQIFGGLLGCQLIVNALSQEPGQRKTIPGDLMETIANIKPVDLGNNQVESAGAAMLDFFYAAWKLESRMPLEKILSIYKDKGQDGLDKEVSKPGVLRRRDGKDVTVVPISFSVPKRRTRTDAG
jgi:hypothetical protein